MSATNTKRDESLHILQHALGLDDFGVGKGGRHPFNTYRNHYVASLDGDHGALLMAHVDAGRMIRRGPNELYGGGDSYCFVVTDVGRVYVRDNSPKPPKLTRAQRRYRAWLKADCGLSFGEWLQQVGAQ